MLLRRLLRRGTRICFARVLLVRGGAQVHLELDGFVHELAEVSALLPMLRGGGAGSRGDVRELVLRVAHGREVVVLGFDLFPHRAVALRGESATRLDVLLVDGLHRADRARGCGEGVRDFHTRVSGAGRGRSVAEIVCASGQSGYFVEPLSTRLFGANVWSNDAMTGLTTRLTKIQLEVHAPSRRQIASRGPRVRPESSGIRPSRPSTSSIFTRASRPSELADPRELNTGPVIDSPPRRSGSLSQPIPRRAPSTRRARLVAGSRLRSIFVRGIHHDPLRLHTHARRSWRVVVRRLRHGPELLGPRGVNAARRQRRVRPQLRPVRGRHRDVLGPHRGVSGARASQLIPRSSPRASPRLRASSPRAPRPNPACMSNRLATPEKIFPDRLSHVPHASSSCKLSSAAASSVPCGAACTSPPRPSSL